MLDNAPGQNQRIESRMYTIGKSSENILAESVDKNRLLNKQLVFCFI